MEAEKDRWDIAFPSLESLITTICKESVQRFARRYPPWQSIDVCKGKRRSPAAFPFGKLCKERISSIRIRTEITAHDAACWKNRIYLQVPGLLDEAKIIEKLLKKEMIMERFANLLI